MRQTSVSPLLPGRNKIGQLRLVPSKEIRQSGVSIGFECLDRFMFDPDRCYDKLAAAGVKWARCQTGWCRCEKEKGVYDFAWLDEIVDSLLERGVQPWFNLGYGNKLYMPDAYGEAAVGHVPLYYGEETLQAWKNYVKAIAEHFSSRVTFWEIWNEANIKAFWQPREADPLEYARLIRTTAPIIREAIGGARIGACTSCVFDPSYTPAFARSGIAKELDVFSYHLYRIQPELNSFHAELAALRRVFDENGGGHVKIHQGEAGYASWFPENHWMHPYVLDSQTNQAKCLLRRYVADFGAGVEMSSFFQMADMVRPYQKGFDELKKPARHGILDGDTYEPKESYYAMAHIASLFDGDTTLSPFFMRLSCDQEMPKSERVSRLFNVSFVTHTFLRNGRPLYVYYLPEDVQLAWPGMEKLDIALCPTEHDTGISRPAIVDLLDGSVYEHRDFALSGGYVAALRNMPIRDYPLLLTDMEALQGRLDA